MDNQIKENSTKNSKNFITGISSIFKKGSNKLSEGFKNIFVKKEENKDVKANQSKYVNSREEINKIIEDQEKINSQDMFQIEQDEDNKELSFHLKNYDDEEEDNDDNDTKVKSEEQPNDINDNNTGQNFKNELDKEKIEDEKQNSKEDYERILKEERETDINTVIHILHLKGTNLDLEGLPVVKFSKFKKENKLISFFKKSKKEELNYLALFSENFVYFIKDNLDGKKVKKIGNRYDLKSLSNINLKNQEDGRVMITLSFSKSEFIQINPEKEEKIVKSLLFSSNESPIFMELIKIFLNKLNKPLQFEEKKK